LFFFVLENKAAFLSYFRFSCKEKQTFGKQKGHLSEPGNMIRINRKLVSFVEQLQQQRPEENILLQTFSPKEQIIEQGKKLFSVYIMQRGIAKCYITEDTGNDFIQEFFGEGELFGEIEAINGNLSFCSIESITEVAVYKIEQQRFLQWLEDDKLFNKLILQALSTKINYKAIRHAYHQSHTIESNLLRLIHSFPAVAETIPKQDIANYLGITLRSLNRTLHELKSKQLIS
jgi:CRP-like cAMP-binding protein